MPFMLIGGILTFSDMWRPQTQLDNQILMNIDILTLNHVNTIVGIGQIPVSEN